MKINFHRVLLGFFENWDKSSQKKLDKGVNQTIRSKCDCYDIITATYFLNVDGTPRRKVKVG